MEHALPHATTPATQWRWGRNLAFLSCLPCNRLMGTFLLELRLGGLGLPLGWEVGCLPCLLPATGPCCSAKNHSCLSLCFPPILCLDWEFLLLFHFASPLPFHSLFSGVTVVTVTAGGGMRQAGTWGWRWGRALGGGRWWWEQSHHHHLPPLTTTSLPGGRLEPGEEDEATILSGTYTFSLLSSSIIIHTILEFTHLEIISTYLGLLHCLPPLCCWSWRAAWRGGCGGEG